MKIRSKNLCIYKNENKNTCQGVSELFFLIANLTNMQEN
jgi:hypothetical protein